MSSRVLLIDAVATNRITKSAFLEAMQYDVIAVADHHEAIEIAGKVSIDLIVLGTLTSAANDVFKELTGTLADQDIICPPVLCLLEADTDADRLQLLKSGVRSVLQEPIDHSLFLATARRFLREANTLKELARRRATALRFGFSDDAGTFVPARRIAVVGLGDIVNTVCERLSAALGYQILQLAPNVALRDRADERAVDVYIVVSDGTGEGRIRDLLPELRLRRHSRNAAVLVLYPDAKPKSAAHALNSGAADAIPYSADVEELVLRISSVLKMKADEDALRKSSEDSFRLAATDDLTGLFNRRYAETYMTDILTRAEISGQDMTLMMIDIDHFKSVNDRFGHAAGDEVLKMVANRIRDNLRAVDLVARFGGEEFLVVMPDTGPAQAELAADRLRLKIASDAVPVAGHDPVTVTASIGVSVCNPLMLAGNSAGPAKIEHASQKKWLIDRIVCDADTALYRAKAGGRDQINLTSTAA